MQASELVHRLRTATDIAHEDLVEAADEIERLRADIESLKRYTGVYSSGWRSAIARPAADVPAEPKQCSCDEPFAETCMSRHFRAGIRCQLTGEITADVSVDRLRDETSERPAGGAPNADSGRPAPSSGTRG